MVVLQWEKVFSRFDVDSNKKLDLRELEMMIGDMLPPTTENGALPTTNVQWIRRTARKLLIEVVHLCDGHLLSG